MGIASLVISILAIILSIIPVVGLPIALIALILAIIAICRKKNKEVHRGLKIAGLVISIIAFAVSILITSPVAIAYIVLMNDQTIIDKADEALGSDELKQVQQMATMVWLEAYLNEAVDIEGDILDKLEEAGIDINKYDIEVTSSGVKVKEKSTTSNKIEDADNEQELIAKEKEINSLKSEVEAKDKEIASLKKEKEQLSQKVETNSKSETVNGLISDMKLDKTFFYQQGNAIGQAKSMTIRLPQLTTNNKAATTFNNEVKKIYEDKVKEYNNEHLYHSRAITYTFNYEQDYLLIYIVEVTEENYGRTGSPDNQTIKYVAKYSLNTKELVLNEGKVWEKISYTQY